MDVTRASLGNSIDQTEIKFLVEKNADGIIVVDENGIVLFVNPAAGEIFGRSTHSLIGSPIGIPVLTGETMEIAVHRPGGNHVDTEIRVVETTWNHRPARLATLRDVSARRAMEERLRYSAKMEAVGRLTAGVAHEFNNLLTVVLGNLESAQRRSAVAEAPVLRALENATRGARRAARLTERLLAFARRKPLEPRIVDINALVLGMSDMLQRTLGEEVNVRTVSDPDLWPAEIDPAELEAAILNLSVNARDAMPAGGTLVIQTGNASLDAAYAAANPDAEAGDYVLVSIADSGSGMTPDVLKQVFEPFFTTKGSRGTGLGLSQVYGFVRQSGGHVKLYSEPGIGTTAKLYLPKAAEPRGSIQEEAGQANVAESIPRGTESILVVEDDEDVRNYTVGSLFELGYKVFEAPDGASALEVLGREPDIRLLFTDLGLPGGMNGRVLAERARSVLPSLGVVITTAYAASALIHDGRLDPGVDLLNKPFTLSALATRIRDVLDRGARCCIRNETIRILVVEDELLVRMLVVDALAEYGCEAEEAANFKEAMEKFEDLGDSLAGAVIDLGLPDRPGDELVSEIRDRLPDLPIILATGYASDTVRARVGLETRVQILPKPFDPESVVAAFQQLGIQLRKMETSD